MGCRATVVSKALVKALHRRRSHTACCKSCEIDWLKERRRCGLRKKTRPSSQGELWLVWRVQ